MSVERNALRVVNQVPIDSCCACSACGGEDRVHCLNALFEKMREGTSCLVDNTASAIHMKIIVTTMVNAVFGQPCYDVKLSLPTRPKSQCCQHLYSEGES